MILVLSFASLFRSGEIRSGKVFGNYILPLEWGHNPDMRLNNIASLLPYHNYVDAERAVGYINEMIDRCSRGDKLFYDLGREDAGLFFSPGKPGTPFAVFCPGGGFSYVGSIHEGFPLALELSKMGYNAFVIQYTGHSEYTRLDPPTYVVIGEDDGIASPTTMRRRVEALQSLGIDAEFHLFPNLRHGFGLGVGTSADGWMNGAVKFWEKHMNHSAGIDEVTM